MNNKNFCGVEISTSEYAFILMTFGRKALLRMYKNEAIFIEMSSHLLAKIAIREKKVLAKK